MFCRFAIVAAFVLSLGPCAGRLSGVVNPSNTSEDGSDWCQPLKPCNETKTNAVRIESGYGLGLLNKVGQTTTYFQYSNTTPATAMDWRTALTDWDVRDQGQCGSCWAFAAAGSLEALVAIVRNDNVTNELSEAQLVDCMPEAYVGCTQDSNGNKQCDGCQGGDPSEALAYALYEWDGLANATVYPYGNLISASEAGTCQNVSAMPGTDFVSVQRVPTTVQGLKQALTNQPVIVGVDASDWSDYYDQQGIYDGSCTATTLNHALVAVGYDSMSTGEEYWILRNQWSASWGAEGYIYLPISSDDDSTGGACGLLGTQNGFPAVYPSIVEATSSALRASLLGGLTFVAVFGVLLLTAS